MSKINDFIYSLSLSLSISFSPLIPSPILPRQCFSKSSPQTSCSKSIYSACEVDSWASLTVLLMSCTLESLRTLQFLISSPCILCTEKFKIQSFEKLLYSSFSKSSFLLNWLVPSLWTNSSFHNHAQSSENSTPVWHWTNVASADSSNRIHHQGRLISSHFRVYHNFLQSCRNFNCVACYVSSTLLSELC